MQQHTEKQKMLAGQLYVASDPQLVAERLRARKLLAAYNSSAPDDPAVRNWKSGGYLSRVSKDPWGNDYRYAYPGQRGREYDLYSVGPDGQEGTDESDKDNIGNWNLEE